MCEGDLKDAEAYQGNDQENFFQEPPWEDLRGDGN